MIHIVVRYSDESSYANELRSLLPPEKFSVAVWEEVKAADSVPCHYFLGWAPPQDVLDAIVKGDKLQAIFNLGAGADAMLKLNLPPVPLYKLRDAGMANLIIDYVRYGLVHFTRDMDKYMEQQKSASWVRHPTSSKEDWPIAVLGLGAIGSLVATALSHDGWTVRGFRRGTIVEGEKCYDGDIMTILKRSRVAVCVLPGTEETRNILNVSTLGSMIKGGILINVGRGCVVDLDAVEKLTKEGHLRGVMLDVFPEEPLPPSHPLWLNNRVIITPHTAAVTDARRSSEQIADVITRLSQGEEVKEGLVSVSSGY